MKKLQVITHALFTTSFFLFMGFSSSSSPSAMFQKPRLPYMTAEVEDISGMYLDYIVVGGGASGCPLAATLSEKFSVLLVERGGSPYGDPVISESKNYGLAMMQTDEFSSIAQSFVSEDGVMNHRGRVLGGSTAINSRASKDYIERVGWDERLVRDAYEWVESKMVFEPNELRTKVGGSIFDGHGKRHSSADLLSAGNLNRITVLLNATVKNVIFHHNGDGSNPMAHGIRFIKSDGSDDTTYDAYLNKPKDSRSMGDVILSAGALGSPQILMLSGIGSQEHLKHFNISPLINATEVGKDIKDNPCISLLIDCPETIKPDRPQIVGITQDFQTIIQSVNRYVNQNQNKLLIVAKVAFPVSKGKLELKNTDPRQNPSVRFNYLAEKKDLDKCVKMGHLIEKVALSNSIKLFLKSQLNGTVKKSSSEELREFCKKNVRTYYHYHGGCGIGSVVDEDYKVYGTKGLRVVDGSTLPDSPGTNPMATLLMLGRYQGIKILKERDEALLNCLPEFSNQYLTTHFNA
ncbi:Glucose-methanol-choline oxidoreductase [Macleaya cordata]|uniref:Glucose-methanol-choline oxidoreductase n=1 Tax=Macleaya cordata TaxID=56857 RepID=A0A200QF20_MACCD|nr:Glucose-methanol-choline oxidoreductase [Macleaya cordata]